MTDNIVFICKYYKPSDKYKQYEMIEFQRFFEKLEAYREEKDYEL